MSSFFWYYWNLLVDTFWFYNQDTFIGKYVPDLLYRFSKWFFIIKQHSFFLWACAGLKVTFIFLVLVLIRVTVPKYKIETLSKLGWTNVLVFLFLIFLIFASIYVITL